MFLLDGLDEIAERYPDFLRLALSIQYSGAIWVCSGRNESILNEIFTTEAVEKLWKNGELPPLREAEVREMVEQKCDGLLDDFEDNRRQGFIKKLAESYEGLPLYVELSLEELRAGRLTLEDLERLPLGLGNYFDKLLKGFEQEDSWQILCKVLALLVWTVEPLRTENLREILQTERDAIDRKLIDEALGFGSLLLRVEQYELLYTLARDRAFLQLQAQILTNDPDRPSITLQMAIRGAIAEDEPARIAEFCLAHARQVIDIQQQSPLEALQKGNLRRAWALADLYEIEGVGTYLAWCILWYLLLVWALKDLGKLEEARTTLERLEQKQFLWFRPLSDWQSKYAVYLLTQIIEVSEEACLALQKQILDDNARRNLCEQLAKANLFSFALHVAQQIENNGFKTKVLINLATTQTEVGDFEGVLNTVQSIDSQESKVSVLSKIATAQVKVEDLKAAGSTFTIALSTARLIEDDNKKAQAFSNIATVQAKVGDLETVRSTLTLALATAELMDDDYSKAQALISIATAQVEVGDLAAARSTLTLALATARIIDYERQRADVLRGIAIAQIKMQELEAARSTLAIAIETALQFGKKSPQQPKEQHSAVMVIKEIALAQAEVEELETARSTLAIALQATEHIAHNYFHNYYKALALVEIATAQAKLKELEAAGLTLELALYTAKQINDNYSQAFPLRKIAIARIQLGQEAHNLTPLILIDRNAHLSQIAAALVEADDRENFKQLLIPCAYYLNSTFEVYKLLLQLYPRQLNAIATIVVGDDESL